MLEGPEAGFHRIHSEPLHIGKIPAECVACLFEFVGHAHIAHEAIVGIHRHSKAKISKQLDWVSLIGLGCTSVHIRRGTHLERDPTISNIGSQLS